MGMRQNVQLIYPAQGETEYQPIFIYSHWGGDDDINNSPLAQQVREALSKRDRWDDDSYLARMIFSQIVKDAGIDDPTGVGLSPYEIDPEFPTITVDLGGQTVNGIAFEKFVAMYD